MHALPVGLSCAKGTMPELILIGTAMQTGNSIADNPVPNTGALLTPPI